MTKVQAKFKLSRPLAEPDFDHVAQLHAVYGIFAARLLPSGDELLIEYDFSRMTAGEVRGTLAQNGIPIT